MTAKRRERFASATASEGGGEGRRRRRYVGHVKESCYKEREVGDAVVIAAGEYFEERSSNECSNGCVTMTGILSRGLNFAVVRMTEKHSQST